MIIVGLKQNSKIAGFTKFKFHDLNLGLVIKARAWKCVGQKCHSGLTFKNVGDYEGMNPHTSKWISMLRVRVLMDS
jgi:hypothetical protein